MASTGFVTVPGGGIPSVATAGDLPVTGSAGQVYVATDSGVVYAWSTTNSAWESQGGTGTFNPAALTESTSSVLTITGGTNAVNGIGTSIRVKQASGGQAGYLSSADWTTFNNKQASLTIGNITSSTTGLTVTGGTGSVIGSGVALAIQNATTAQPGLLTAADWNTFNGKANLAGPTFTGTVTLPTTTVVGNYVLAPTEFDSGNSGSTKTITWSNGSAQKSTLTASCTYTLAAGQTGGAYVLRLVQGGAGSFVPTLTGVKWPAGTVPTWSTAVSAIDLVNLYYDGTTWYGTSAIGLA